MSSTLILQYIDYGLFPSEYYNGKNNIYIRNLFNNPNNIITKIIRKIAFKADLPILRFIFLHWIKLLDTVDTIIIFDNNYAPAVTNYIHKKYPNKRIIVWYWNSVDNTVDPMKFNRNYVELWSFDEKDCEKYNLQFNTQFYCGENVKETSNTTNKGVLFIGVVKNKERLKLLQLLKNILDKSSINSFFYLVQGKEHYKNIKYYPEITYDKVAKLIENYECILDITSSNQVGMSLRPLEALFFSKKLITNNPSILNCKLYNKNNVYYFNTNSVLGEDIKNFLARPYDDTYSEQLKSYYSFENWVKRFYE